MTRYLSRLLAGLLLTVAPLAAAQTAGAGPSVTIVTPSTPTTITTGGASQVILAAKSVFTGAWVTNPATATEPLYICPAGGTCSTTVGNGVYALGPGETFVFPHIANQVTGTAATAGHAFSVSVF